MHKRAQEHMVATRGGIRKLHPELQDELLKLVQQPGYSPTALTILPGANSFYHSSCMVLSLARLRMTMF